jgi:nickel transport protein
MCAFVVLFLPSPALAHKVTVFAYVEGDTVVTDSYFNDGRKCRDSIIEVFDEKGNKLIEGKTDTDGRFSFRAPGRTDLVIRLTASMGHRAEYEIPGSDLPESLLPPAGPTALETPSEKPVRKTPNPSVTSSSRPTEKPELRAPQAKPSPEPAEKPSVTQPAETALQAVPCLADIEQAVDRALARQLEPIYRELEESRRRENFSEIAGGIGYIVGLMGLAAYFHSRKDRKQG